MAYDLRYSTAHRQVQSAAQVSDIGASPVLRFYNGTKPANVAAAITGTLLAQGTLPSTPLSSSGGVISKTGTWTLTGSAGAAASAATHFRLFKADGTTAVIDGTVGVSSGDFDMEVDVNSITEGQTITVTGFTLTRGNA